MSKTKLEKVLEHLLNNQEGQAKALLHQIFIEKARSIHEDLMTQEEGDEFGMGGSGSDEDDFLGATGRSSSDIGDDEDEIEFEEVMSEEDEEMADDDDMADVVDDEAGDDMDDMDGDDDMEMGGDEMDDEAGEMQGMEKGIDALSKALQDLQSEFDRLQGHEGGEAEAGEEGQDDMDFGDEEGEEGDVMDAGEEGDVEEDWLHEEDDWDDLEEGLKLDVVTADMLNQQKTPGEVGSGPKFSGDVGRGVKSPLPASQKDRMGAGPVTMGKGTERSGYERESAPSSASLKHTGDNRRSKATQGMSPVSKEGAAGALLNKSTEGNKRSPLSRAPAK